MTLSCTLSCVVSPKEKKKKKNINNDLAVLPSHDNRNMQENILRIVSNIFHLLLVDEY